MYVRAAEKLKSFKFSLEIFIWVVLYFTGSLFDLLHSSHHLSYVPDMLFQFPFQIFLHLSSGYCRVATAYFRVTKCKSLQRLWMSFRLLEGILMSNTCFFPSCFLLLSCMKQVYSTHTARAVTPDFVCR